MSKVGTWNLELQEQANELGYSTVQEALDAGYEVVGDNLECPHEDVEFFDDEDRGECALCHATCDWHWEKDVDDMWPDHIKEIETRIIDCWYEPERFDMSNLYLEAENKAKEDNTLVEVAFANIMFKKGII